MKTEMVTVLKWAARSGSSSNYGSSSSSYYDRKETLCNYYNKRIKFDPNVRVKPESLSRLHTIPEKSSYVPKIHIIKISMVVATAVV